MRQWGKIGLKDFYEYFSHDPGHGGGFSATGSRPQGDAAAKGRMSMCGYLRTMVKTWNSRTGAMEMHLVVLLHLTLRKGYYK
jgi:hypothetical protein